MVLVLLIAVALVVPFEIHLRPLPQAQQLNRRLS
jgi:hypothetical protein